MRRLSVLILALSLVVLLPARPAAAAASFSISPTDYTYGAPGTPAATTHQFAWSATAYGLGFQQSVAPFTSIRTNLSYGPASSIRVDGSPLSGFTGGVLAADASLRVALEAGPIALGAYGGYEGFFFNASGSGSDRVVLTSSAARIGVDAGVALAPGVALRGNYTITTGLTTSSTIAIASNPGASGNSTGAGSGNEYEIALVLSPVPLTSVYAGYRSGTQQISWNGGANSTATFSGWMVGMDLRF